MIWSEVLAAGPLLAAMPVIAVHCYALGTAAVLAGFLARKAWLNRLALAILSLTFGLHTLLLGHAFLTGDVSLPAYVSLMAWSVMLAGLISSIRHRQALMAVLSPVALLVYLSGLLMSPIPLPSELSGMFSVVHVGALFGSMALLALAFGAGCLFLLQQKQLKAKARLSAFSREIPALNVLDKINALAVAAGFPLFTVGLLTGFVGARVANGRVWTGDPKELVSLLVWGLFAMLYHQRLVKGWQGRKPAMLAMLIFAVCIFSLTVVNIFLPTHHGFTSSKG